MPVFSVVISDEGLRLSIFEMPILVERHSERSLVMPPFLPPVTHWGKRHRLSYGEGCRSRNTVSTQYHGDLAQCLHVHRVELRDRLEIRLDRYRRCDFVGVASMISLAWPPRPPRCPPRPPRCPRPPPRSNPPRFPTKPPRQPPRSPRSPKPPRMPRVLKLTVSLRSLMSFL